MTIDGGPDAAFKTMRAGETVIKSSLDALPPLPISAGRRTGAKRGYA
jgi:hypothetical protein